MKFCCLIVITLFYLSCKSNKGHYYESKDKNLTVQIALEGAIIDTGDMTIKVRLLPGDTWANKLGNDKSDFYYHMDSCFYLNSKKGKTYALLVEPIANGTKANYEYLLSFERVGEEKDTMSFVYQDKYLNKKTYQIKLN